MQALSKATPGETYTIQWMFGQPEVLDFLHSHSVDEGERILCNYWGKRQQICNGK